MCQNVSNTGIISGRVEQDVKQHAWVVTGREREQSFSYISVKWFPWTLIFDFIAVVSSASLALNMYKQDKLCEWKVLEASLAFWFRLWTFRQKVFALSVQLLRFFSSRLKLLPQKLITINITRVLEIIFKSNNPQATKSFVIQKLLFLFNSYLHRNHVFICSWQC